MVPVLSTRAQATRRRLLAFLEKLAGAAELEHPVAVSAEQVSAQRLAGHTLRNMACTVESTCL
jgi:hypothetical protein